MAKAMHRMEIMELLSGVINSNILECHYEEGLGALETMEYQMLVGAALSQLGAEITKAAKDEAMTIYAGVRGKQIDGRLIIEYRAGGKQTRVDSAAVRKLFPPDESPELWKEINTRESISVTIGERVQAEPESAPASTQPAGGIPF